MNIKAILLITSLFFLTACASSSNNKAQDEYSNQMYGRVAYGYNYSK